MRTRAQRRNLISAWYLLGILLVGGAVAAVGLWAFADNQIVLNAVDKRHAVPDPAIPVLVDEDSLNIAVPTKIIDSAKRPLWATTRRPYVPPPPKPKPKPKPKPEPAPKPEPPKVIPPLNAQLNSVILMDNMKMVFLRTAQGTVRLELGMSYNDWQLVSINEDSAEFHFDEEKKVLQLRAFANVASSPVRTLGGKNAGAAAATTEQPKPAVK